MNRVVDFFRGTLRISVTGAEPQECFRRFTQLGVSYWKLSRTDELTWNCTISRRQLSDAQSAARRSMCELRILEQQGFARQFSGLLRRPVLLVMLAVVAAGIVILPNFIWTMEVEGNDTLPDEQILQELESIGVHFGTWIPDLPDHLILKYEMQLRIPELQWIAVNCAGGKATVLVSERRPVPDSVSKKKVTNLVAVRDGVILDMSVLNGFAAVAPGQAVQAGDLLVSGFQDSTISTQATRSLGEVYALTIHKSSAVFPATVQEKHPTGKTEQCIYLNFGRKRIKIFGSSGISVSDCDKIVSEKRLTLPGGYTFPLGITVETYVYYREQEVSLPADMVQELLVQAAQRRISGDMIAGQILSMQHELERDAMVLHTTAWCQEMIARAEEANIFTAREDNNGTDHQRRTD